VSPGVVNYRKRTGRTAMNKNDRTKTPEYLKGSTVDAKGLPIRMKIQGERRLDRPYQSATKFKLVWDRINGVVLVPEND
jgi:hypothetical protein